MNRYHLFVLAFVVSILAIFIFVFAHISSIFRMMDMSGIESYDDRPVLFLRNLFSPLWISSLLVACIASLTYKILGIIFIVSNPNLQNTERVIWVLGFLFFGFITAIVFMALKNTKNLLATQLNAPIDYQRYDSNQGSGI